MGYEADGAPFGITTRIHAENSEYRFVVSLTGSSLTVQIAVVDSVVCGDVYLINGQSNSHPTDPLCTYTNEFCRSFGVQTPHFNYDPYNPADTCWGLANGDGLGNLFSGPLLTGVWGIRLQQLILESYGIPTCVINGGSGGSNISYNLRNDADPMDLNTAYGRLLYRAVKSRVKESVKGFFWYQGENDGYDTASVHNYAARFGALHNSWKEDYPTIERVYVFQINMGCGEPTDSSYHGMLREVLRRLPQSYPDVSTLSTFGIAGHTGCHFSYEGYTGIAENVFRLVAKDFYGSFDTTDILPPDITRAYFTDSLKTTLALEFAQTPEVIWPVDTTLARMQDYLYLDGMARKVTSGYASGNRIMLSLSSGGGAHTVTYLPNRYYTNTHEVYEGPFVTNTRGIGALAFDQFPIDSNAVIANLPASGEQGPNHFSLQQNYPNPFNPTTTISYSVTTRSLVSLTVFDLLGRHVATLANETMSPGAYQVTWDATMVAGGVYYCRLEADGQSQTKKLVLLK